jgi:hypothetical protein
VSDQSVCSVAQRCKCVASHQLPAALLHPLIPCTTNPQSCCASSPYASHSKLISIDVRDCPAIGPKSVDMISMLLPNCSVLYLQGKQFTGH